VCHCLRAAAGCGESRNASSAALKQCRCAGTAANRRLWNAMPRHRFASNTPAAARRTVAATKPERCRPPHSRGPANARLDERGFHRRRSPSRRDIRKQPASSLAGGRGRGARSPEGTAETAHGHRASVVPPGLRDAADRFRAIRRERGAARTAVPKGRLDSQGASQQIGDAPRWAGIAC